MNIATASEIEQLDREIADAENAQQHAVVRWLYERRRFLLMAWRDATIDQMAEE